ncbi:MAG: hypothetical protein IJI66_16200, partial [Erysipelotrichaceae bacterium]|nr:hypothetical protein [Erysipelotrichaceae bacterium]
MSAIRTVDTLKTENNEVITTLKIEDHDIYVYRPEDIMMADIINYAYSAPLLLVFADKKLTTDEAIAYAKATKLDKIAQENGGSVVFANPKASWDEEKSGLYEEIISKTRVKQWGFSNGILYDDKVPRSPF